uniref:Uncharacterized protein n=1 Tax=viral metagenome TaxID=1070528 RepID=A0A6C0HWT6_9ZZZZ
MSNISTRVRYDKEELSMFDKTNVDSNRILLDRSVKENDSACYAVSGARSALSEMKRPMNGSELDLGLKADIESRLMNRNYELSNHQGRTNKDFETNNGVDPGLCGVKETLVFEDSRYTNPVVDYREMYTADYAFTPYLFVSPQEVTVMNDRFMNPNRYGESSRYVNKQDKYDIKPKQFASLSKSVDYNDLVKGLLPNKASNQVAATPYI